MMVVPPRATHSFANTSETEEAEVYMTATPGKQPIRFDMGIVLTCIMVGYYIDCE